MLLLLDLVILFCPNVVLTTVGQLVDYSTVAFSELFHAHFIALFYSAHYFVLVPALQKMHNETIIKMLSVATRKLKNSVTVKKEGLIPSKIEQYEVILI